MFPKLKRIMILKLKLKQKNKLKRKSHCYLIPFPTYVRFWLKSEFRLPLCLTSPLSRDLRIGNFHLNRILNRIESGGKVKGQLAGAAAYCSGLPHRLF